VQPGGQHTLLPLARVIVLRLGLQANMPLAQEANFSPGCAARQAIHRWSVWLAAERVIRSRQPDGQQSVLAAGQIVFWQHNCLVHAPLQQISPGWQQWMLVPDPHGALSGGQAHVFPLTQPWPLVQLTQSVSPLHRSPQYRQLALLPSFVGIQFITVGGWPGQHLNPEGICSPQSLQSVSVHRVVHVPLQHFSSKGLQVSPGQPPQKVWSVFGLMHSPWHGISPTLQLQAQVAGSRVWPRTGHGTLGSQRQAQVTGSRVSPGTGHGTLGSHSQAQVWSLKVKPSGH
jgi:hypothetical protein